ncbi:NADH-quinone oxidoreductase chain 2 [Anopheles sinensis]|uniref:NADH-quinone oxidoreductase chain 2 n=1 Tax=Anopheles sinensis TaxID=74873 RepID=A0A084WQI3_ANOSI|nr:NADH-quinone oxidoreductase chain 2 [Anopheles sinensis]
MSRSLEGANWPNWQSSAQYLWNLSELILICQEEFSNHSITPARSGPRTDWILINTSEAKKIPPLAIVVSENRDDSVARAMAKIDSNLPAGTFPLEPSDRVVMRFSRNPVASQFSSLVGPLDRTSLRCSEEIVFIFRLDATLRIASDEGFDHISESLWQIES